MSTHLHSKMAHEAIKPSTENIRKAIRHVLFCCSEALTDSEILDRVQDYMDDPQLTINSVAPRVSEMLKESPPRLKVAGFKEYDGRNRRKVRKRTTRPLNDAEQLLWLNREAKNEAEKNKPQISMFSEHEIR